MLNTELDLTAAEAEEFEAIAYVEDIQNIKARIAILKQEEQEARDQLALLLDYGSHQVGDYKVSVTSPAKWTPATKTKFAEQYPADLFPYLYKLELDTKAADTISHIDTTAYKVRETIVVSIR